MNRRSRCSTSLAFSMALAAPMLAVPTAASLAGEAHCGPVLPRAGAIFTHHVAKVIMLSLIPATPVVDYEMPCEALIEQAVWFSLRGLGVEDEAIRRYYNPEALAILSG